MSTCPVSAPAPSTVIACTAPTRPPPATGSIRPSCSSTPMRAPSRAAWRGTTPSWATGPATPPATPRRTGGTARPFVPKSVVIDPAFDWQGDRRPGTPWHRTVIYEAHVKGMTARHPDVPAALRGTYAGLAAPPVLDHLRGLGVTAVELLPVHHAVPERALAARGLTNYWGYNSIGYFAPDARFASGGVRGGQVAEFKSMVRALHGAGLEVILDVVYNHTAEGSHRGPTLAFRGIDNHAYYRLDPAHPGRYVDYTGCGNTLNTVHPRTLQLVLDSLRYWVRDMHVDGFRFDLATALARRPHAFDRFSAFFAAIQAGSRDLPGQAHRRALGPRGGRLPGGEFPARMGGVERPVPRHVAALLAGRPRSSGGARLPAHRVEGPLRRGRAAPLRQRELRHRPRRLHPRRPGGLRAQAQRRERRGQPGRHRRQFLLEQRGGRTERRSGHPGPARAAGAQLPRLPAPVAGRAHALAR